MVASPSSRRGFTLVEAMMAALMLGVCISGLVALWNVCFIRIHNSGQTNAAGEVARAELERAKTLGADNFPTGSYTVTNGVATGSWVGVYDPTAPSANASGYVRNGFSYYSITGVQVASNSSLAKLKLQLSVTDSNIMAISGSTSYTLDMTSRRAITATVWHLPDGQVWFQSGTNLVKGGL